MIGVQAMYALGKFSVTMYEYRRSLAIHEAHFRMDCEGVGCELCVDGCTRQFYQDVYIQ